MWLVRTAGLLFAGLLLEVICDVTFKRASPLGHWIARQDSLIWIAAVWLIALTVLRWTYVLAKASLITDTWAVLLNGGAIVLALVATILWRRERYG